MLPKLSFRYYFITRKMDLQGYVRDKGYRIWFLWAPRIQILGAQKTGSGSVTLLISNPDHFWSTTVGTYCIGKARNDKYNKIRNISGPSWQLKDDIQKSFTHHYYNYKVPLFITQKFNILRAFLVLLDFWKLLNLGALASTFRFGV